MTRLLFVCAVLMAPAAARADEPTADLSLASFLLEQAADDSRSNRTGAIVLGVSTLSVLAPTGAVLLARGDDVPHIIGTSLVAAAAGAALTTVLSLQSSPAEDLYAWFEARRATGMSASELLRATEQEWEAAAESSADRRARLGTIETAVGGVFAITGAALLLAPRIGDLPRRAQYTIGALLAGTGVPVLTLGVHALFVKTPTEVAWDAYRAGKRAAAISGRLLLGLAGANVVAQLTF